MKESKRETETETKIERDREETQEVCRELLSGI